MSGEGAYVALPDPDSNSTEGEEVVTDTKTPPFFRGEDYSAECDFLLPTGGACDVPPAYEVWWKPVPALDGTSKPVSAACAVHVLSVDRNLVHVMHTHPTVAS